MKYNNFESFLKELLLVKQYRVEIWKKNNKTGEWILTNHVCLLNNILVPKHFPYKVCLILRDHQAI